MKKNLNLYKGMRPAAVMLLCTCIAFSAVMPYVPPALPAAAEKSSSEAERPSETASTAREETEIVPTAPAPPDAIGTRGRMFKGTAFNGRGDRGWVHR